jgi:hypothetical protein
MDVCMDGLDWIGLMDGWMGRCMYGLDGWMDWIDGWFGLAGWIGLID